MVPAGAAARGGGGVQPPSAGVAYRGGGAYAALLAGHFAAAGATVSVLTSGSGGTERVGAVTVHRRVSRWDWHVRHTLRAVIAEEQPDIVHLQYQTGMYAMHPAV